MLNNQSGYFSYKKLPNARIRLLCFSHAGGGASTYHPWVECLAPHIEMIAIQLPGRENRFTEPLINNIEVIVNQLTAQFIPYQDKPFFVFGHSLGALIAFEFVKSVHQLYAISPFHMVISAAKAPHLPQRMKRLSELGDEQLKDALKVYDGIDECLLNNDELFNLFVPIIKSDFSLYENYNPSLTKAFSSDISVLSGREDKTVNLEEILAWQRYTTGKFEHIIYPGKHFFLREHQKSIVNLINKIGEKEMFI